MFKRRRFIIGGLIILAALSYIIYGGMQQAIVYFGHAVGIEGQGERLHRQVSAHGRDGGRGIAAKRRQESHLSLRLD